MAQGYDFANILFAGPCNLRCPYCIGRQVDATLNQNNLDKFPLRNLDRFVHLLQKNKIAQIVFTGTTTDPQLYRHEARLLAWLREKLPPLKNGTEEKEAQYSLHTNGQLALRKMDVFNQYNRVCLSLPSFNPDTYRKMTGSARVPNLAEIMRQAKIPVKVSCLINEHNVEELAGFLERCGETGVKRLVLRQMYGDPRKWDTGDSLLGRLPQVSVYQNNPVYDFHGMEVTYWNFQHTASRSLNFFSNGAISPHYLLVKARSKTINV
ncbi:MAG: radical SAM protein [Anaerolineae bacterium]|nr:radical SAM protein [Anaerolineae bacterium]